MNGWITYTISMDSYSHKWWRCVLHDLRLKIIISERRWCFGGRMSLIFNNCVSSFLIHSIWEQENNIGAHLRWTQTTTFDNSSSNHLRQPRQWLRKVSKLWHLKETGDTYEGGELGLLKLSLNKATIKSLEQKCRRGNSPAGWRSAPALNPKMRKGLIVLPVLLSEHQAHEHARV